MRRFTDGVVYRSTAFNFDTGEREEVHFLVLNERKFRSFVPDPIAWWALNLYTGEKFEFHRDLVLAENATSWDSFTCTTTATPVR